MAIITSENPHLTARLARIGSRQPDRRLLEIIVENMAIYNQATALGLLLLIVPILTFFAASQVCR